MPDDKQQPRLWVRVVEAHATRTWVAVILAVAVGLSIVMLVAGAAWNTIANPEIVDLSSNYTAAISSTLGVLVGALAAYVGNSPNTPKGKDDPLKDDEMVFDVEQPIDTKDDEQQHD